MLRLFIFKEINRLLHIHRKTNIYKQNRLTPMLNILEAEDDIIDGTHVLLTHVYPTINADRR